jgi:hypothetical protein
VLSVDPFIDEPTVHDLPSISAKFLVRHGFDRPDAALKAFDSHGYQFIVLKLDDDTVTIWTDTSTGFAKQHIELVDFWRGDINIPAFICPYRRSHCLRLYFDTGTWASREAWGLKKPSEKRKVGFDLRKNHDGLTGTPARRPSKGKLKQQQLLAVRKELLRLGFIPNFWGDLGEVLNADVTKTEAAQRRPMRAPRPEMVTLAWAIDHGARADSEWPTVVVDRSSSRMLLKRHTGDPHRPSATLEEAASIDIATIRGRGWLDSGKVCWNLGWPLELTGRDNLVLVADARQAGHPQLRVEFSGGTHIRPMRQTIDIVERDGMPGRLFMKCPALGTLHGRLYLRDGFFASAKAQRLIHRSKKV